MVLEQLYPIEFLKERPIFAFLLSFAYTIFATFFALLIFPQDPALVIVAVASTLLIPSFYQFTTYEEELYKGLSSFSIKEFLIMNKQLYKVYAYAFFGSFFVFAIFATILPRLATNHIFKQQLGVLTGGAIAGIGTTWSWGLFWSLLSNNLQVLALCFIVSVIAGNGSIFLILWNASVWGTVFGNLAKTTALNLGASAPILLVLIMFSVFPHVLLEMSSYIVGVMSGTILSNALAKEKLISRTFAKILALTLLVLLLAVIIQVIAMLVETYVLGNFVTYQKIIMLSFGA